MPGVLLFIAVLAGAALFGMMGLGSGILYVPLLSWWGLDFVAGAVPLALLLSSVTGAGAALSYLRERLVDLRVAAAASATVVVGSPLGVMTLRWAPVGLAKVLLAVVGAALAARLLIVGEAPPASSPVRSLPLAAALAAGVFVGFFSALIGVGGGFIMVPLLLSAGYPAKRAVGTSSVVVAVSTLSGFLFHLSGARFPLVAPLILLPAAATGSMLGGLWASRHARHRTLRYLIITVILVISIKVAAEGMSLLIAGR